MKKIKNTNQVVRKVCNISTIIGTGLVVFSIASMGYVYNNAGNLNDELDNKKDEIIASSSFNEYIQDKYQSLYQKYLDGEISTSEYSDEIENIVDSDNVLSGNHEAVDEKLNQEVNELNYEIKKNDALVVSTVIGLTGGVAAIVGGVTTMPITKESDLEM